MDGRSEYARREASPCSSGDRHRQHTSYLISELPARGKAALVDADISQSLLEYPPLSAFPYSVHPIGKAIFLRDFLCRFYNSEAISLSEGIKRMIDRALLGQIILVD
jgi:hypothetical protein